MTKKKRHAAQDPSAPHAGATGTLAPPLTQTAEPPAAASEILEPVASEPETGMSDAAPEVDELEEDQEPPPPPAKPVPKLKRFRVSLPHQPETEHDAIDKHHAVALYKEHNGVIDTDHKFSVHELTDQGELLVMGGKIGDEDRDIDFDEAMGGATG